MSVNLDNGIHRINVLGVATATPTYFGKKVQTTLGGRTTARWLSKLYAVSVAIEYMSEDDFTILTKILDEPEVIYITTDNSKVYRVVFIDDTISLAGAVDAEGDTYYSGTLHFKE